jgi:hypothetical protein
VTPVDIAQAWAGILPRAVWFEGWDRQPQRLKVSPTMWDTKPGQWPAVREEDLTVTYADGTAETYQLLSAYRPLEAGIPDTLAVVELPDLGEVALSDAVTDVEAFSSYLDQLGDAIHPAVKRGDVVVLENQPAIARVRIGPNAIFTLYRIPKPEVPRDTWGSVSEKGVGEPRVFSSFFSADDRLLGVIEENIAEDAQRIPLGFGARS